MSENITEKVTEIIVVQLGVSADQVKPESKMIEDLGADSLDAVELVMAVEEEFGIEVPDEEAEKLVSVGDIVAHVEAAQSSVAGTYHGQVTCYGHSDKAQDRAGWVPAVSSALHWQRQLRFAIDPAEQILGCGHLRQCRR